MAIEPEAADLMSTHSIRPVKLFVGMIYAPDLDVPEVERVVELEFSNIDTRSAVIPFTHTTYYESEMGSGLQRCWLSTAHPVHPAEIADIKNHCIRLEKYFARENGTRRVNLDPGYLELSKIVLPTTKDRSHRIYLRDGIFAEVTLHWERQSHSWQPFEHTYADYRCPEALTFFKGMREIHQTWLKTGAHADGGETCAGGKPSN